MSFRALAVSATLATAFGFAPSTGRFSSSRVLSMSAADLPGAAPFGFFDPLNLSAKLDATELSKYREAEIKHGRVAMIASVGILGNVLLLQRVIVSHFLFYLYFI